MPKEKEGSKVTDLSKPGTMEALRERLRGTSFGQSITKLFTVGKDTVTGLSADKVQFSPLEPLQPTMQEIVTGRRTDFDVGANINFAPRSSEPISFAQLRALAEYELVRLCIETRKDELSRLDWSVDFKEGNSDPDATCKEIVEFFRYPDGDHDWATWLRGLMEDMLGGMPDFI